MIGPSAGHGRETHVGGIGGLLLAAGAGRRFGRPKAAVPFGGEPLVERGARLLTEAGCAPVVVVLGAGAEHVVGVADLRGATVVVAQGWAQGMGVSLRTGLAALGDSCAAVVIALVDQPLVGVSAVERLCAAWRAGALAAVATYDGARGTPALFDATVWSEIAASAVGDQGARGWLTANPERVLGVECGDVASSDDIDTVEDLQRLGRLLERP